MTDIEKKVLAICLTCKAIRFDDKNNLWLNKDDNPVLYDRLSETFKDNISHGYCPEHCQEFLKSCNGEK